MLCLKCGTENSADALFCEQCGAKLELSCAICGAPVKARQMLSDIYGWFTEGFEFADLKDAKALLDELTA